MNGHIHLGFGCEIAAEGAGQPAGRAGALAGQRGQGAGLAAPAGEREPFLDHYGCIHSLSSTIIHSLSSTIIHSLSSTIIHSLSSTIIHSLSSTVHRLSSTVHRLSLHRHCLSPGLPPPFATASPLNHPRPDPPPLLQMEELRTALRGKAEAESSLRAELTVARAAAAEARDRAGAEGRSRVRHPKIRERATQR